MSDQKDPFFKIILGVKVRFTNSINVRPGTLYLVIMYFPIPNILHSFGLVVVRVFQFPKYKKKLESRQKSGIDTIKYHT